MTFSVYLLLEVTLACASKNSNLISIVRQFLGTPGVLIAIPTFLLLLYAALAAYTTGGGQLLQHFSSLFHYQLGDAGSRVLLVSVLVLVVLCGMRWVDYLNRFFMLGLIVSYIALLVFIAPHVQPHLLMAPGNNMTLWLAAPVVTLSFTSHIIVPSLNVYCESRVAVLKRILLLGGLLPLVLYLFWELAILGVFPKVGAISIAAIIHSDASVSGLGKVLEQNLGLLWVGYAVAFFSFCALITSFLGLLVGLVDFICDGLQWRGKQRYYAILLAIIPPVIFAIYYPNGFLLALGWAGICVAILYGIFPAMMAWKVRYIDKQELKFQMVGGRLSLLVLMVGALLIIILQGIRLCHHL